MKHLLHRFFVLINNTIECKLLYIDNELPILYSNLQLHVIAFLIYSRNGNVAFYYPK